MKTITIAIAASLFTATAAATDVYHGLDEGNSDLSSPAVVFEYAGVQPGVGDSIDIYGGIDDGNADLFKSDRSGPTDSGADPDIYMNVRGNSDLHF